MEFWANGEPPRSYKILGIIDDARRSGWIAMSQFRSDIVKKAREVGGDAVILLSNQSQIDGFLTSGSISMAARTNFTTFAVIKYLD